MKIRIFALTLILIVSNVSNAQNDKEPDFTYSIKSNLTKLSSVSLVLNPLDFDVQIGGAISGGVIVTNIAELVSAEFFYSNYYATHLYNSESRRGYMPENFTDLSAKRIDFRLGFNFSQNKKTEDYGVTLKARGNTKIISFLPCEIHTIYAAKIGFLSRSFFSKEDDINFNSSTANFDNALIFQSSNIITLGVSRKLSIETTFETNKYGEVIENVENELYVDALFSIGNSITAVERLLYENAVYPNEYSSIVPISSSEQIAFKNFHKNLPVGLRIGARVSGRKMHNVTYNIYGGIYPRAYAGSPINIVNAGLSIGYRFMYKM
ncbi:MAG: hypothetical protein AB8B72_09835 [Crocinitomicaceae bacterium]